ncbi:MAG: MaoC/PaaZ C-terminal domain-containing protein [Atribacterota bacterium]|nr:MaoC/PaaZ C-terminal domain-containing protein [Atribacterota bacterium]
MDGINIGESVNFSKTISESDIYLFAGITGDFSPNHINEEYMKTTKNKQRIAHGALIVGFMSATSTLMGKILRKRYPDLVSVNYGFDRIRYIKPVVIGDTITVIYTTKDIDLEKNKIFADVRVVNQREELVAIATNIIKVLKFHK